MGTSGFDCCCVFLPFAAAFCCAVAVVTSSPAAAACSPLPFAWTSTTAAAAFDSAGSLSGASAAGAAAARLLPLTRPSCSKLGPAVLLRLDCTIAAASSCLGAWPAASLSGAFLLGLSFAGIVGQPAVAPEMCLAYRKHSQQGHTDREICELVFWCNTLAGVHASYCAANLLDSKSAQHDVPWSCCTN